MAVHQRVITWGREGRSILAALLLLTGSPVVIADESDGLAADEVRAEVVAVDPVKDRLTVRILETGDPAVAKVDEVYDYSVSDDVDIRMQEPTTPGTLVPGTLAVTSGPMLRDLTPGTRVRLDLAADRPIFVIGVLLES